MGVYRVDIEGTEKKKRFCFSAWHSLMGDRKERHEVHEEGQGKAMKAAQRHR